MTDVNTNLNVGDFIIHNHHTLTKVEEVVQTDMANPRLRTTRLQGW